MSEIEEKIAEVIDEVFESGYLYRSRLSLTHDYVKRILSLIQIEVDCKECNGVVRLKKCVDCYEYKTVGVIRCSGKCPIKNPCIACNNTGKITKPVESDDVGRIIISQPESPEA